MLRMQQQDNLVVGKMLSNTAVTWRAPYAPGAPTPSTAQFGGISKLTMDTRQPERMNFTLCGHQGVGYKQNFANTLFEPRHDGVPGSCRVILKQRALFDAGRCQSESEPDNGALLKCLTQTPNVVMAAATGYGPSTWNEFILPLRHVYDQDIVILVNSFEKDVPESVRATLERLNVKVELLSTGSQLGTKGNRYMTYANVCSRYDRCFATDFRDVLFQANPFRDDSPDIDLILAQEHVSKRSLIGTCPYNSNWVSTCWPKLFNTIRTKPIICSGTITGSPKGFSLLGDEMVKEMAVSRTKRGCTARDQGHLIFLYYSGRLQGVSTKVEPRDQGVVDTVGYLELSRLSEYRDSGGYVVRKNGPPSSVLHQYDRFPELKSFVQTMHLPTRKPWRWVVSVTGRGSSLVETLAIFDTVSSLPFGWNLMVFHHSKYDPLKETVLDYLRSVPYVILVDADALHFSDSALWHFAVASDPTVSRFIARDSLTPLSRLEHDVMRQWAKDDEKSRTCWFFRPKGIASTWGASGMWRESLPDVLTLIRTAEAGKTPAQFLAKEIWPACPPEATVISVLSDKPARPPAPVGPVDRSDVWCGVSKQSSDFGQTLKAYSPPANSVAHSSAPYPVCAGILAYQGIKTLENTLQSFVSSGMMEMVQSVLILFQDISTDARRAWVDDLLRRYPKLTPIILPTNIGWAGFQRLAEACDQEFFVPVEEDFAVKTHHPVHEQLQNAVELVREGVADAVRMRGRVAGGGPNYSKEHLQHTGGKIGATHLISCLLLSDHAEVLKDKIWVCKEQPKTWCLWSRNGHYTNNPVLYRTAFARSLYDKVPKSEIARLMEEWITVQYWPKQDYVVAWSEGIFEHVRLDRTRA